MGILGLESSILIASSGLAAINRQISVVSQNVANASTPDYAREVATQTDLAVAGQGFGVLTGPTQRQIDLQLQAQVFTQNATVAGLQTRQAALQGIDSVQGTPGNGDDLSSQLGRLQDAFSNLQADPSSNGAQGQVISAASTLARHINAISQGYAVARQNAQSAVESGVAAFNTAIATISDLTTRIIAGQQAGQSTADLENQRDVAMHTVSNLVDVRFVPQTSGGLVAVTSGGLALTLTNPPPHLAVASSTAAPGTYYPGGGIQPVTLNGQDVTAALTGGSLGANLALRDQVLPTYQGELDEFANTLATRLSAQGLALFTAPSGTTSAAVPPPVQSGYIGYAAAIDVNPAVAANPSQVRDGNVTVAGSPTGASAFTPNPPGGPASFTGLISRVLSFTFGAEAQPGVAQPAPAVSGLGLQGTLQAPYAAPSDLAGLATAVVSAQSADVATVTSSVQIEQAVQSALQQRVSATSGVSTDTEMANMVQLQNAYGANARVLAAAQAMWDHLLNAVP